MRRSVFNDWRHRRIIGRRAVPMRKVFWVMIAIVAQQLAGSTAALTAGQAAVPAKMLDYDYFKTKVQPVFLEKRTGYTRCVVCHAGSGEEGAGFLQRLSPGATAWDEEQ